jgi:hypothetical protein
MKKSIPAALLTIFPLFIKARRLMGHALIAIVCLTGCTTAQVRWDAIGVREQVMKFYNDEIMDNLVRMKEGLPFVHVDVSTVSAAAASQLTGSAGGGDTRTFSRPGLLGAMGTVSRSVVRPFSFSITPLRSDTLTITAAPVIGTLTNDTTTGTSSSELVPTKITETKDANGNIKETTTERTAKPAPNPKPTTIYDIYERFGRNLAETALIESISRPGSNEYVPGALRWREGKYFYIVNDQAGINKAAYRDLCMALLKQSRAKSTATATTKALERTLNEFQDLKARESLPQTSGPR